MKSAIRLGLVVLAMVLAASSASGQAWEDDADDGTGLEVPEGTYVSGGSINGETVRQRLYYFISATTSTDSETFKVARGDTVTVTVNADVGDTATNTLRVNLLRRISPLSPVHVNNGHLVGGASFTGGGTTGMQWEIPYGEYWVEISAASGAGEHSLVVVEVGIGTI